MADLSELFNYNPETGLLVRLTTSGGVKAGTPVGLKPHSKSGHIQIRTNGRLMMKHRICWELFYGEPPKGEIDHINGNPSDNRIDNLRDVSRAENMKNKALSKANKSGVIGVNWSKSHNSWQAAIRLDGKLKHLGRFKQLEDAARVRKQAEQRYGFHENHGRLSLPI